MINLVTNAAKYSEPNKTIRISAKHHRATLKGKLRDVVDVSVRDQGIGIKPKDIESIFEPFFRAQNNQALRRKGTGIGLSITRYIIQAHQGEISVESTLGVGSRFTLRFPVHSDS